MQPMHGAVVVLVVLSDSRVRIFFCLTPHAVLRLREVGMTVPTVVFVPYFVVGVAVWAPKRLLDEVRHHHRAIVFCPLNRATYEVGVGDSSLGAVIKLNPELG